MVGFTEIFIEIKIEKLANEMDKTEETNSKF
jgi:hypothetical protein